MSGDLEKFDRMVYLLNKKIRFRVVNPINVEKEKKKIMKDKTYNPQLQYKIFKNDLPDVRRELMKLHSDESILGRFLSCKRNEMLKMVFMLQSIGTPKFSSAALNMYGRPSKDLVKQSRQLLDLESDKESTQYTGINSVKKFLDALLSQGLNWKVKEMEMLVGAYFDVSEQVLYINSKRRFSENDLKRLVVHEIGTHITRAENARKQKHRLFWIGLHNYLPTEEGLAVYNEEQAGLLNNDILKMYAGRVVAVDLALKSSFSSVYNSLLEFFSKDDAFILAMRVKRGMADTSNPGGFSKDHYYLKGYYEVKKYVKKGGKLDPLYAGKIGIEHIPFLKYVC